MYYTCKTALDNWVTIQYTERKPHTLSFYKIGNPIPLGKLLASLYRVDIFQKDIDLIYGNAPELRRNVFDKDELTPDPKETIDRKYAEIRRKAIVICDLCESLGIEIRDAGLDIKLPPTTSLAEMSHYFEQLDKVFSKCPTLRETGCIAEVRGTDVGSVWAIVAIVGTSAIIFAKALTEIVDQCVIIRTHIAQAKLFEENARKQQLANDLVEPMVLGMKKTIDGIVDKAVDDIASAHDYGEDKNEEREQIRFAINTLGELMSKGMEIHCAIGSNEEVQELFPPIDNASFLENAAKQLLTSGTET